MTENFLHLLDGLEVSDPRTLGSLLDVCDLGCILAGEKLSLDIFGRLQIIYISDEDALGLRLWLVWRLARLVCTVGRHGVLVLVRV